MQNTSQPKAAWTLADFLDTYRYWALFLASLLAGLGGEGLNTVLPLISRETGSSHQTIAIFYLGSNAGWIIGAFLAFVVASRQGRPALIVPLVVCALVAVSVVAAPSLWASPVFLFLFGLSFGTVRAVFPLAIAIFLVGGRPGKVDFGCALTLMSATILTAAFAPIGTSWLYQGDQGGLPVILGFLACLVIAVILLLPARRLSFDDMPRQRHRPLTPQKRSPLMVAAILTTPLALIILLSLIYGFQGGDMEASGYFEITLIFALLVLVVAIAAFIYLAYWCYRIHGELAGSAPSQRLLTPLTAMLIAILVPLGLPILLMTLGDLLNDRGRESGQGRLISIAWLALWSFLFPPVAIALVQNAANRSYDWVSPEAA
ncbi:hypothetical protein ATY77_16970 [Rhizobium sp. R634]|uniref:hypothetical protein n=1 Tax=Rhizobium sp. R634 TaxID=1764274 RepID=UPI000B52DE93|nr:hypothetical protein [Rhizobium sp. R634]OWV70456.1 hypothetical protein ATY77_16970 [Rhizobium sp. R634]